MLTPTEALRVERRRRPRLSLRQQYDEYIFERIEGYKNSIPREQLLRIAAEANADLQAGAEGQFVLTEVVMLEAVDERIKRRLKLRSFRHWARRIRRQRDAQREPTHWGLDPSCPVGGLLRRIEPGDQALVLGPVGEGIACLLAAHDMGVTFIAGDLGSVTRVEARCDDEALGAALEAFVVEFALWLPPLPGSLALVVVDANEAGSIEPVTRAQLLETLQESTGPAGVHVLLPGNRGLAPEALLCHYDGWIQEEVGRPRRRGSRSRGIVLRHPSAGAAGAPADDGIAV
ncbi:MAG TPA: hypothetical protein VFU46_12630 [Gemmatimonadales bacterium]|nr:hypothetical protein [Gemmatimonadales bacterium]